VFGNAINSLLAWIDGLDPAVVAVGFVIGLIATLKSKALFVIVIVVAVLVAVVKWSDVLLGTGAGSGGV
jgi:hypothetical protein